MKFSIVAIYSGGPVDGSRNGFSNETNLDDIERAARSIPSLSVDRSEEGDSEYDYCFAENDDDEFACELAAKEYFGITEIPEAYSNFKDFLESETNEVWLRFDRHAISEFMTTENGYSRSAAFWYRIADITVSGILDRHDLYRFFLLGLADQAENCQTMGTLGGPASMGLMPDISCTLDSPHIIASIRITPLLEPVLLNGQSIELTKEDWERTRRAFINIFGHYKLDRNGREITCQYADISSFRH
jgi:hypothetical protein